MKIVQVTLLAAQRGLQHPGGFGGLRQQRHPVAPIYAVPVGNESTLWGALKAYFR